MITFRTLLVAGAAVVVTSVLPASIAGAPGRQPPVSVDAGPVLRSLEALRKLWADELASLSESARTRATSRAAAAFIASPNLPYILENYSHKQLSAERINTVLIIDRAGKPLFWRRTDSNHNRGFQDALVFLGQLPKLTAAGTEDGPALAGAVRFEHGSSLVVAMPIFSAAGTRSLRGWLVVARSLDAGEWQRYADRSRSDGSVPLTSASVPNDAADSPRESLVPVVRVEPARVLAWMPINDVTGRPLQLFSASMGRTVAPTATKTSATVYGPIPWVSFAVGLAALSSATMFMRRRKYASPTPPVVRSDATVGPSAPVLIRTPPRAVEVSFRKVSSPEPGRVAARHVPRDYGATPDAPGRIVAATARRIRTPIAAPIPALIAAPTPAFVAEPTPQLVATPTPALVASPAPAPALVAAPTPALIAVCNPLAATAFDDPADARTDDLREVEFAATIVVAYQPQMDLKRNRIAAVEARLCVESGGQFIPSTGHDAVGKSAAHNLGLTERCLLLACNARRAWRRETGSDFPVCVPIPPAVLEHPGFVPLVRSVMQQCDLEPRLLELEILDSAFASQRAVTALRELCADGVRVCIEGFGTRASSLRSLTLAPIAKVRVGIALVRAAESDRGAAVFLRAIAGAAQAVGASVCTTGVASQDDVRALNGFGQLLAQGVLFGAPVDGDGILTLLTDRGAETAELPVLIL